MPTHLILTGVLMGAALTYTLVVTAKRKAAMPAAFRQFLDRTGYRYADLAGQPLDAHVAYGLERMNRWRAGYRLDLVREFHGTAVHLHQESGAPSICSWWIGLPAPPRRYLQIVDRDLATGAWRPAYPVSATSGDAELDRRFVFHGYDAAAVQLVVRAAGLKDLLLGCALVDLTVRQDRVVFADPSQKNLTGAMGGTLGMMAMGSNVGTWMDMAVPVHDRIAQLLATVAGACR